MLLLIDNYDSFTYNLVHYLGEIGVQTRVVRNDAIQVEDAMAMNPRAIVVSPGPCDPAHAGICVELIRRAAPEIPIFGVCLGHQAIGEAFGAKVVRANEIMHGKLSRIAHSGTGVFRHIPENFPATRYHSLTLEPESLPGCLEVTARSEDGTIMGVAHKQYRVHGVQFHPESIRSEHGKTLLANFLKLAEAL